MKVQLWKSSSAFITFDLPSGKSQVPRVAIIMLSACSRCQKNSTVFFLSFSWGKLPPSHLLGSLLILQFHTSSTVFFFFFFSNISRQFRKPSWSVVLKIIKFRLNPRAGQSMRSPKTIFKVLATLHWRISPLISGGRQVFEKTSLQLLTQDMTQESLL